MAANELILIYKKEKYIPYYEIKVNIIIGYLYELKNWNVAWRIEDSYIFIYKIDKRKYGIIVGELSNSD